MDIGIDQGLPAPLSDKADSINNQITGCSIPVVRLLWEQVDWVRFPAARQINKDLRLVEVFIYLCRCGN